MVEFITKFQRNRGRGPTESEIADGMGLTKTQVEARINRHIADCQIQRQYIPVTATNIKENIVVEE